MMVCSITSLRVMLNWRCSTSAWAVMAGFCLPGRCVSRLRARAMRRWFTRTLRDRPGRIPLHSNCALAMPGKSAIQTGGGLWLNLSERAFWQPLELARPNAFFSMLRGIGLTLQTQALPDHFAWQCNPFIKVSADIILVTEKDAVKCRAGGDARFWAVPVHTTLDPRLLTLIMEKIRG